jgi:ABC-type multidrug transport system ATPase subunit
LSVRALSKRYATKVILQGIELEVGAGEVVALRGPNGAGKSTLIGCVVGEVVADSGEVSVAGVSLKADPVTARKKFRYLAQQSDPPAGLTGEEMLCFWRDVYGAKDLDEARELCGLGDALDRLTSTYSVGMRRRLSFAQLAMGRAPLYIVDEPFAGVDAAGREKMCSWLLARKDGGAGLLMAAHDSDAPELARLDARTVTIGVV